MAESDSDPGTADGFVPTRGYLIGEIAFVIARVWMLQDQARATLGATLAAQHLEDAGFILNRAYKALEAGAEYDASTPTQGDQTWPDTG